MVLGIWPKIAILFTALLNLISLRGFAQTPVTVQWKDDKAISITVPVSMIDHHQYPDGDQFFSLHAAGQPEAIIGTGKVSADNFLFTPYWPFTRGMDYEVKWKGRQIATIHIPEANTEEHSSLQIFPSCDTVPANLLKIYLQFSRPMMQENIYQFITVLKNGKDTVQVFLELQPPLWNEDQTRLTLWLDPGRIKRELVPNRLLGKPLEEGNSYTIVVSPDWRDKSGVRMKQVTSKTYSVSEDDRRRPQPARWRTTVPAEGTKEPFTITFGENLDYSLLQDAICLARGDENVKGKIILSDRERQWSLIPETPWREGNYKFVVRSRLEDLAGNNLNRLFDKDLGSHENSSDNKESDHIFEFNINH